MGRNAQRRRAEKAAAKRPDVRRGRQTKAMQRLRERMQEVQTKAQIEEMIAAHHPERQPKARELLYALADPGLPCCGPGMLIAKGHTQLRHSPRCPAHGLVVLADR